MIERQDNLCRLGGDLNLDTVPELLQKIKEQIRTGVDTLDCSSVKSVDSSALGLLLACKREAMSLDKGLKFIGIPESVTSLASLYGVADQL